jgi:ATP-binding cassette subfamily B protein
VERQAFARAWRFLGYSPVAKWAALAAAVGTAVLFTFLLLLLGLFTDLMVHRGHIPRLVDLPPRERAEFLDSRVLVPADEYLRTNWMTLPENERRDVLQRRLPDPGRADQLAGGVDQLPPADRQLIWRVIYRDPVVAERRRQLQTLGVDGPHAEQIAAADPRTLPPADQELLWRTHVYETLAERVGPEAAADSVTAKAPDEALPPRGALGMVARSPGGVHVRLVAWLARWNPWMWKYGWPEHVNLIYLSCLLGLAVAVVLLRALLLYLMRMAAARATIEATCRLRRAVYQQCYRLGTLAFRALGPSEAVSMMTRHVETIHDAFYTWLTVVWREPVKFVLLIALAVLIDVRLTLAFLCAALIVWLIGGRLAASLRQRGRVLARRAADQLALLQESLMLLRLVKTYLMERFNQNRVERQLNEYARSQLRNARGEAIYRTLLFFLGAVAALLLLYVAGLIVLGGQLGMPRAITLATALVCLYWPVQNWLEHWRFLRRGRHSAVALFQFLDRPGEVAQVVRAELLPPLRRELEFHYVTLKEPGTGRMLLQGVNLKIPVGQRIGLVGPDDMEKHALVYLIPRFLDPNSGEVRIDGHDLRWVTLDSLRVQTALVLQHNLVFNDTVANNIGCGDASYPLPRIIEAAKVAHAHHFIQKLPQGYETPIGELGHSLKLGEQFRIALARAILRDPSLYIIEEPTTPLDEDTKALLDDTFHRVLPGKTVIFLPHRTTTIRSCDRLLLLHNGTIEATGDHRELLARSELYRHLQYIEFNVFADQTG